MNFEDWPQWAKKQLEATQPPTEFAQALAYQLAAQYDEAEVARVNQAVGMPPVAQRKKPGPKPKVKP